MNKPKTLRSLTVVPEELYVERDADRQVREILDEMGRPGYVLVARQMGKTNLLLHAKQFLQRESDIFLYIDISNPIPELREFFRNIIDVALEVCAPSDLTRGEIHSGRVEPLKLPHKEHENELRILLRSISGRLIICLDEIDAIAGSTYSDQVFTFIRSVYFGGRVNFPEFNRLTYLLSGVAEPSDIIKNKDVSPFNIGEKIYLNDFSEAEVNSFIGRGGLIMSADVMARVFYWTNGHPRMTWDVCSELEDRGPDLSIEAVDSAVKKLYFGDVELPPIDHIKKLVVDNKEIRDAAIAIHYKKTSAISQNTRTKLYLAGITSYDVKEKTLYFKNQILEAALSEAYLVKSIPEQHGDALTSWVERAEAKNFAAALPGLLVFVTNAQDDVSRTLASYYAGYCHFWMGNYEEALNFLKEDSGSLTSDKALLKAFYTGVASWELFRYQSASVFFEYVVSRIESANGSPWLKAEAEAYLASCLVQDKEPQTARSKELCRGILEREPNLTEVPVTLSRDELLGFSSLVLAQNLKIEGDLSEAVQVLNFGIDRQEGSLKVDLAVRILQYVVPSANEEVLERAFALAMLAQVYEGGSQRLHENLTLDQFILLMTKLIDADRYDNALQIAEHVFQVTPKGEALNNAIATICGFGVKLYRGRRIAAKLFGLGLEAGNESLPNDQKRELLALVLYLEGAESLLKYGERYLETFEASPFVELELADFRPLYMIIAESKNQLSDHVVEQAYRAINRSVAKDSRITAVESASIALLRQFISVRKALLRGEPARAAESVRDLRKLLDSTKEFKLTWFPSDFLVQLRTILLSLARPANLLTEKRLGKKIGRNDVVKVSYGGEFKVGKHKKFEADLASGLCELVDELKDPTPPPQKSDA